MPENSPAPTPERAVYGFFLYLLLKTLFFLYLIWAFVPESWFEYINITYLPKQYWAVTIPVLALTLLATFAFVIYPSLSLLMTPNIDDVRTIIDKTDKKFSHEKFKEEQCNDLENLFDEDECICESKEKCSKKEYLKTCKQAAKFTIPVLEDLDILDVTRNLYLKKNVIF